MPTILLIEDNDHVRENTAEILELANYKVLTAPEGKTGIRLAEEHKPDLIICDLTMPILDGFGVLHLLSKKPELSYIPFIFLTARSERADIRKGMDMGADDYITKPFDPLELLNSIERRLKKASTLKEAALHGINGVNSLLQMVSAEQSIKALKEGRNILKHKKKQCIYQEGNHPSCLFYILKGKIKIYKTNEDGKELITGLYNEGDFLGYAALLEDTVYKDNAETMDETELAVIPRKDFDELTNVNPQVTQRFIKLLANNIAEKETQLLSIAYNSLRKKVAEALLTVHKKYSPSGSDCFGIDISRENLAAIAGVAKESLIRTVGDFRDEKLVDIKEGYIFIINARKLADLAN
ncbi:cAMP-binding domain of CRP or a regulatory subunit of cAMP-dependent protein kinases [Chitinophaga sp. YR627]|uniref:response regulator n=1 Tax=Chitinophaga sp. YR627 TaxID=1881041 RepID=UPI0008DF5AFE|nr:response regulator [Chitinophaga sp. YR627]SFM71198.1 cAMP-binding domain of CRP or a regulatory subunit of cAMP-dependent protein kinases [Chitinophaga sp. YR627]